MGSHRDVFLLKRSRRQPPHLPLHPREGLSLCFQCRPRDCTLVFLQLHSGDGKNQTHKWPPPPPCNSIGCKEVWGAGFFLTRVCTQHRGNTCRCQMSCTSASYFMSLAIYSSPAHFCLLFHHSDHLQYSIFKIDLLTSLKSLQDHF